MPAKTLSEPVKKLTIKRLPRHRASKEYLKNGAWTPDPDQADTLSDVVEVAVICARHGLNNVELALRYQTSRTDVFCTPIR